MLHVLDLLGGPWAAKGQADGVLCVALDAGLLVALAGKEEVGCRDCDEEDERYEDDDGDDDDGGRGRHVEVKLMWRSGGSCKAGEVQWEDKTVLIAW